MCDDWARDPFSEACEAARRGDEAGLREMFRTAREPFGMLGTWELAALAAGGGHAGCLAFLLPRERSHHYEEYAERALRGGHDAVAEQVQRHADAHAPDDGRYLALRLARLRASLRSAGDDAAAREAAYHEYWHELLVG